ncbi:MAG: 16S rRNA (adenine(1518)-N(6)/adenine(1519)-N(6))-dimethyltransferase RsmA [Patescibacteria group bacterium]
MLELSKKSIISLCQQVGLLPHRSAGQNFLFNKKINQQIIEVSSLKPDDLVLEIGSGFGFLTDDIAARVKKIVAVELDRRLAFFLKNKFARRKNIEIIQADIFKVDLNTYFKDLNYKLISNLPYNITSLVLRNFLTLRPRPKEMIILVQKEVAQRITALPGKMSLLAVFTQFYSSPKIILEAGKEYFWPRPEINSTLIKLENIGINRFNVNEMNFAKLVKIGFSAKRKKLTNNLKHGLGISAEISEKILKELKLPLKVRAQELSLENWLNLTKQFFDILG